MAAPIRTFLAIQPPRDICERLVDEHAKLRVKGARLRPVPEQNIHLTIEFFGSVPSDSIPVLVDVMDQSGSRFPPLDLEVVGISAFPSRRPVVIAAETTLSTDLEDLVADLKQRLSDAGFAPEARPFRPHITVARIKAGHRRARGLTSPLNLTFSAEEIVLFRSDLSSDGARYSRLHETKLTG